LWPRKLVHCAAVKGLAQRRVNATLVNACFAACQYEGYWGVISS
jgi:hypothetical protein